MCDSNRLLTSLVLGVRLIRASLTGLFVAGMVCKHDRRRSANERDVVLYARLGFAAGAATAVAGGRHFPLRELAR